jgi:hypothetical protein
MLNQVVPDPTPFNRVRRRPSLGRILFWSYILGIPLIAVGAGIIMLIASSQLDAAVQTYRTAGLCPAASTSDACFTLVPGTLVRFNINRGKTGDTAYMTIQLPTRTASTWAMTSWAQEDALHVGVPLRAKQYQGMISAIYVGDTGIETKDSPMYKQGNLRQGAIFVPIIGLALGAGSYWALRRRSPSMPVPITMIDATLPIVDQERLLRQALSTADRNATPRPTPEARPVSVNLPLTLHPRPIPTSYPWWLGLIAAGIGIPSLVLRMRTPAAIAQVVIAATVLAMLAAIILHWLYRHRRTLLVDHISVRHVNLFGMSREIPRAEVAGLALRTISSSNARVPDEPRLLILDATGRCLLRLTRYYPTEDDAAQLAAALGVPLPADAGRFTSASRLRRTIPGAASWVEAHPYLTSLVLLPPILAAIVLFVFALNGLK